MRMAAKMKTHSIAAAARRLDLFATRFCMPTPQAFAALGALSQTR
jgi:hypothetical protein